MYYCVARFSVGYFCPFTNKNDCSYAYFAVGHIIILFGINQQDVYNTACTYSIPIRLDVVAIGHDIIMSVTYMMFTTTLPQTPLLPITRVQARRVLDNTTTSKKCCPAAAAAALSFHGEQNLSSSPLECVYNCTAKITGSPMVLHIYIYIYVILLYILIFRCGVCMLLYIHTFYI